MLAVTLMASATLAQQHGGLQHYQSGHQQQRIQIQQPQQIHYQHKPQQQIHYQPQQQIHYQPQQQQVQYQPQHQQVHYQPQQVQYQQSKYSHHEPEHYNDHPQYEFHYKVEDEHTGDYKEQQETRDGDSVKGFYWLLDADGYRRLVEYTVDGKSGFVAKVTREPTGHIPPQPKPQPHHAAPVKVVAAAPLLKVAPVQAYAKVPAPVHYHH